jgi:hypothetical protein
MLWGNKGYLVMIEPNRDHGRVRLDTGPTIRVPIECLVVEVLDGPLYDAANDRQWTLKAAKGVWQVETGAGYPYTLGEKVVVVPKAALEAEHQKVIDLERRLLLYVD